MIRFTFTYLRPVAILLLFSFLFQCCKAYDLKLTPLEEAVGPQKRYVKITSNDLREHLFDSIYYKNDTLYGLLRKSAKNNILEIEIQKEDIKEIQIHVLNKQKSKRRTAILIAIPLTFVAFAGVIYLIADNMTYTIDL